MNIVDKILVDPITRGLKFFTKGGAGLSLLDYAEGVWTPTLSGGLQTLSSAYWHRHGPLLHLVIACQYNLAATTRAFPGFTLPFSSDGSGRGLFNIHFGANDPASYPVVSSANVGVPNSIVTSVAFEAWRATNASTVGGALIGGWYKIKLS